MGWARSMGDEETDDVVAPPGRVRATALDRVKWTVLCVGSLLNDGFW